MDSVSIGHLIYLIVLGLAVAGWFFAQNRESLGKTTQQMLIWGLIFIGVIGAVGLWQDIRDDVMPRQSIAGDGRIEVPLSRDGHYYLTLEIEGEPITFTVDTGASGVVLSPDDARRIGLDPATLDYLGEAMTANGIVRTARVTLENVRLGTIEEGPLRVYVNEAEMDGSLLGMDYLRRFERIEIARGRLVLLR